MATYVFNWRVTRHVRTIGNSLVRFRFQPAEYAGEAQHMLDLCAFEDNHTRQGADAGTPPLTEPPWRGEGGNITVAVEDSGGQHVGGDEGQEGTAPAYSSSSNTSR